MTRKDFELIAYTLNDEGCRTHNWQAIGLAARALAKAFVSVNPRFKDAVFFTACGLDPNGAVL